MLNMDVSTVLANGDFNRHIKRKYITDKDLPLCFTQERHTESIQGVDYVAHKWRMKERMKTVSVALVICLNVGVDPPDVVKTQPCARLECWIDPLSMSPNKALEKVGANLQAQYERWQPRARYKQSLDPTTDEVKKLCTSLRRNAKEERVLFHYNGHGVPKPTTNGEIWVFNRTYTQYIPLSIYDLQAWMGAPSIYVYDCSNAGIIVDSFKQYASQHELEFTQTKPPPTTPRPEFEKCIQLAACSATQVLPMNPELPADLFTACLTTPIKVALRWFVHQSTSKLVPKVTLEEIDRIPGQITDRRTMIGELNWIFTAITDTIAWNTLPRELFQKLFRQDLLVASLFRNFLLAERIMRSCDCSPVSSPPLPPTYQHPMWNAWDLALDLSLGQLPNIIKNNEPFQHLPFFEEQLTAFQVWLELGSENRHPPEQLPIVLQVLLSQVHRMRALELLGKFLDLGPWAVNLALSVGIFPYILKLLQSSAKELRPLLVFIWAKILAVDNTCQTDLVRDNSHKYFLMVLQDGTLSPEHRTQAAFVLACIVNDYPEGKSVAMQSQLVSICLEQLNDGHQHLRQWVTICLGRLWDHYEEARWTGVRDIAHEKLYELLHDPCPEVRAAAVFALGTFINSCAERTNHANNIDQSVVIKLVNTVREDLSSLVRQELVNALQWFVLPFETSFINVASTENTSSFNIPDVTLTPTCLKRIGSRDRLRIGEDSAERLKRVSSSSSLTNLTSSGSFGSVYTKIWSALCNLESDPYPEVAKMAGIITKHIRSQVKEQARDVVDCKNPSLSLPPSPNRGGYLSGESPPTLLLSPVGKYSLKPYYVPFQKKKPKPYTISEESDDIFNKEKSLETSVTNRLVATNFIEWSCKRFAQSVKKENTFQDIESKSFYERDWRYVRNNNIRKEAIDEQKKALSCKLESQFFNTRTAVPPTLLQFHPFDQQIAVAGNDSFGIWDWGTGAKTTVCKNKSAKQSKGSPITALEWINGHDNAMLMVAADDGSVKIYRPNVGQSREPRLVTAWQAFDRLYQPKISGVLLAWEQWTQTVITAGDAKCIRFWDVEQELHSFDLPTGTDYVTCIDSTYVSNAHENFYNVGTSIGNNNLAGRVVGPKSGQIVAGGADGSVMLFDRRCPASEARVHLWVEHSDKVLDVQLKENLIVSGSADGDVKLYDIRANSCISTKQVQPNGMSCISFHRHASTYACGSLNQTISIYNLKGNQLNTIRFYEGFMGHRIGPVTCLNYHPYKVVLAAGTSDCSISVYCLDGRR